MLCDDVPAVVADIDIVAAPLMNVGETRFEKETIVGDSPCQRYLLIDFAKNLYPAVATMPGRVGAPNTPPLFFFQ